MPGGTARLLRLTLQTPDGTVRDVAVDSEAVPADLLPGIPAIPTGPPGAAGIRRLDGRLLEDGVPLAAQEVDSGDRLFLDVTGLLDLKGRDAGPAAPEGGAPADPSPRGPSYPTLLSAGLLLAGALLLATSVGAPARPLLGACGAVVALAAAVLPDRRHPGTAHLSAGARLVAPLLAAGAVAVVLDVAAAPQRLLAATAAGVAAASVAALLRMDPRVAWGSSAETGLLVEMVAGIGVAAASGVALLAGFPVRSLAAVVAGLSVPLVRMLPGLVVRVPDGLLLDVDRVSVTAWSAKGGEPGTGEQVSPAQLLLRIRRDRLVLETAVGAAVGVGVTCVGVACLAGVHVGSVGGPDLDLPERIGTAALVTAAVTGLLLMSRTVRGLGARVALLGGGLAVVVAGAGWALASGDTVRFVAAGVAAGAGAVAVGLAVARGRGWSNLRWARVGDVLEALAVAAALPAGLLAAGVVSGVRSLVS
jgi:hypothetical protein